MRYDDDTADMIPVSCASNANLSNASIGLIVTIYHDDLIIMSFVTYVARLKASFLLEDTVNYYCSDNMVYDTELIYESDRLLPKHLKVYAKLLVYTRQGVTRTKKHYRTPSRCIHMPILLLDGRCEKR